MRKKVVILGGGVAGLSAAHELIERGFDVTLYETKSILGGKARSTSLLGTGRNKRKDLPGEHGFRFFPKFYKHVIDTMKRTPVENDKTAYDNLVSATVAGVSRYDEPVVPFVLGIPKSRVHLKTNLKALFDTNWNLSSEERDFFIEKIWQIMTSSKERRNDEYERMSWWEFLEGELQSENFQKVFTGATRSLVAANAKEVSMKTIGNVLSQLLLDFAFRFSEHDRLLNGPTNEVWINPWVNYLKSLGVEFISNSECIKLHCKSGKIEGVSILRDNRIITVKGDYYLSALPVESMEPLISMDMIEVDPTLAKIKGLSNSVGWMNGIQFYLTRDLPILHGHILLQDSPWALTLISQNQFWSTTNLKEYGDGKVKGILSLCISEWNEKGTFNKKKASECTREEIKDEIWKQLKRSLNGDKTILHDTDLHSWSIDLDIDFGSTTITNHSPLLLNKVNTWNLRPTAITGIPNLFLASDYVQTNTDIASMEAANEAARRAVNGIIEASASKEPKCDIWEMYDFELFTPWHIYDFKRYHKGLPWNGRYSIIRRMLSIMRLLFVNENRVKRV